jgi:PST family polysaccharide transporter
MCGFGVVDGTIALDLTSRIDTDSGHRALALEARSLESIFWLTLQNGLAAVLLVAVPAVLARLLTPEDLGLLEISLAFFGIAALFMELGTGPAIIQRPAMDETFLSTVFLVNVATAIVFALILVAGAVPITAWLRMDARLVSILRWVGLTLLPVSTGIVPRNLLARRLEYRRVTFADALGGAAAVIAALTVLSRGLDEALIVAFVAYGTVAPIVVWIGARWRPAAMPAPSTVWPLLKFSLSVSGSRMLDNLSLQSDRFLIGRFLGAASLGIFGLARTLVRVPLRYFLNISEEILLPGLALLQTDRARARSYYLAVVRIELVLLGPAVIFAAVFALDLSRLLFGPNWDRAALVAQLLTFAAWRNITGHTTGAVLLSQGRPDLQLRWTIYALLLSVVYVFAGMPWGLEGVALAAAILEISGWALRHTMANAVLDLGWRTFAATLAPVWVGQAAFVCWTIAVRSAVLTLADAPALRLALGAAAAAAGYGLIMRFAARGLLTTIGRGIVESVRRALSPGIPGLTVTPKRQA